MAFYGLLCSVRQNLSFKWILSLSDSMDETDEGFVQANWIGVGKIYDETLPHLFTLKI